MLEGSAQLRPAAIASQPPLIRQGALEDLRIISDIRKNGPHPESPTLARSSAEQAVRETLGNEFANRWAFDGPIEAAVNYTIKDKTSAWWRRHRFLYLTALVRLRRIA
jgi:hypothetical protein